MSNSLRTITTATAIGSGLAGGVFFAFSSFVMPALRKLPSAGGISAMQSINKQAPTPAFMTLLFGTAALSAGLGVYAIAHRDEATAGWLLAGSLSYLSSIVITGAFHVPRNDKLSALDPNAASTAHYWTTYLTQWTLGNHVRTLTCTAAAVLFTIAARQAA